MTPGEIVQNGNGMTSLQQELGRGASDIASATCNQNFHSHGKFILLSQDRTSKQDSGSFIMAQVNILSFSLVRRHVAVDLKYTAVRPNRNELPYF